MKIVFKVTAVAALLAGCAQPSLTGEQMIAQKKGAIIFFVDMNRGKQCVEEFTLGQFDASVGGYRVYIPGYVAFVGATGSLGDSEKPSLAYLPAGQYGIVSVNCHYEYRSVFKTRGGKKALSPFHRMWPNAIAVFEVKTGEYVNIGQLTAVGIGPFEKAVISDVPQQKMQLFKKLHPDFADKIVTRLMTQPPLRQPSGE